MNQEKFENLKPIDTSKKEISNSAEAQKELARVLGMSENAKPEAIHNAVKYVKDLHDKFLGFRSAEFHGERNKELLAVLFKLKSAASLQEAQGIIEKEYNVNRKESDTNNMANTIRMEPIGKFSIDGQDYTLIYSFGENKLTITKGDSLWEQA